jgi:hypothetical protein
MQKKEEDDDDDDDDDNGRREKVGWAWRRGGGTIGACVSRGRSAGQGQLSAKPKHKPPCTDGREQDRIEQEQQKTGARCRHRSGARKSGKEREKTQAIMLHPSRSLLVRPGMHHSTVFAYDLASRRCTLSRECFSILHRHLRRLTNCAVVSPNGQEVHKRWLHIIIQSESRHSHCFPPSCVHRAPLHPRSTFPAAGSRHRCLPNGSLLAACCSRHCFSECPPVASDMALDSSRSQTHSTAYQLIFWNAKLHRMTVVFATERLCINPTATKFPN